MALLLAALVPAALAGLAACGGSSGEDAPSGEAGLNATPAPVKVRPQPTDSPVYSTSRPPTPLVFYPAQRRSVSDPRPTAAPTLEAAKLPVPVDRAAPTPSRDAAAALEVAETLRPAAAQQARPTPTTDPTPAAAPPASPPFTPTVINTPTPTRTPDSGELTTIELRFYDGMASVGEEFAVEVRVAARFAHPIDAAQVYLDYDPAVLEAVSVTPGLALEHPLHTSIANSRGEAAFAAVTLNEPLVYQFILCTVLFRVKERPLFRVTQIGFADLKQPHQTKAIRRGANVTGKLAGVNIPIR